jgi:VCBS repeat protein
VIGSLRTMFAFARRATVLTGVVLVAGYASVSGSEPPLPSYVKALTLGSATEWRFHPLVADFNKDGHVDLVATARLVDNALHIWLGDGKGMFNPVEPAWTDIGYAALATGDINDDGSLDIVGASHFGGVQTLLNDGSGKFSENTVRKEDGYVGAQLADLNEDGHLDLILLGFRQAGVEVYLGDGTGNWRLQKTLPDPPPGRTLPGRTVVVSDLNHDRHLDLVVAFQRWGIYIYYGDGTGGFTGGPVDFYSATREFESVAVGDVNKDGHPDIVINGTQSPEGQPNGPDAYLGDGRGGWTPSSAGLKALKFASAGIALGDLDGDGSVDIIAAGNDSGMFPSGYGLFWFRGDGKGGWRLVRESGLPVSGLSSPHSITLADLDNDRIPEIIVLSGGVGGSITIWKRKDSRS